MKIKYSLLSPSFALLILSFSLSGQGVIQKSSQEGDTQSATDTIQIQPFESTAITEAFSAASNLISESGKAHLSEDVIAGYNSEIDTLFSTIHGFLSDSTIITLEDVSVRDLENFSQRANFYMGGLDQLRDRLAKGATNIEEVVDKLARNNERWLLTLQTIPEEEIIESRVQRIERTIHRIDSVKSILNTDLSAVMVELDRLSDKLDELELLLVRIREKKTQLGESLFSRNMPGLFEDLASLKDSTLVSKHISQFIGSVETDRSILKAEY